MLPHGFEATDWLELPEPILHPDAPQMVAARCGESAAVLQALLDGEVYRDPLSDGANFKIWPWYPEQDEELRGPATRRADELGAEISPWLDDPFESAFYLRFTGERAFVELARERGLDTDNLYLTRVPRVDPRDDVADFEGGQRATHPWHQRFGLVREMLAELEWLNAEYRALGLARVREALRLYADTLSGLEPPPHRPVEPLYGDVERDDDDVDGELQFEHVVALEEGALLQVSGWLIEVNADSIRVLVDVPAALQIVGSRVALLTHWGAFAALDLDTLQWIDHELDLTQTFGGPVLSPDYMGPLDAEPELSDAISPDGRYGWEGDRIVRLQDGLVVAEDDVFGDPWDPPADAGPPLTAFEDLSTAGQRQTVIDGVTFTHRNSTGFRVRDSAGFAFALHDDHWRGYAHGQLWRNDEIVASIGVSAHAGAFSRDAERLFVLTDTDLLEIAWKDVPKVVRQTPLFRIVGAVEDARDD